MSQQRKLEKVLDLLLSEQTDKAGELLHQIIIEKSRNIYENIIREEYEEEGKEYEEDESEAEVGGDPEKDFTDEISSNQDDINTDEINNGEAGFGDEGETDVSADFDSEEGNEGEGDTESRIADLESELAELRAEFDQLMGEEMQEPEHADLAAEYGEGEQDEFGGENDLADVGAGAEGEEFNDENKPVDESSRRMFEKKAAQKKAVDAKAKEKLEVAKQDKKTPKGEKVEEETQFLQKVSDTGQRGTAKLVGTGKGMSLGAEQNKSPYSAIPARKDYGGKPVKIGGGTGGEYGKYSNVPVTKNTNTNANVQPKKVSDKAGTTPKFSDGKSVGKTNDKAVISKKVQ